MAVAVAGWIKAAIAGRRVAVAGWEWYRWREEIKAVRMVPFGMW
jgi:hypothetical protein